MLSDTLKAKPPSARLHGNTALTSALADLPGSRSEIAPIDYWTGSRLGNEQHRTKSTVPTAVIKQGERDMLPPNLARNELRVRHGSLDRDAHDEPWLVFGPAQRFSWASPLL